MKENLQRLKVRKTKMKTNEMVFRVSWLKRREEVATTGMFGDSRINYPLKKFGHIAEVWYWSVRVEAWWIQIRFFEQGPDDGGFMTVWKTAPTDW